MGSIRLVGDRPDQVRLERDGVRLGLDEPIPVGVWTVTGRFGETPAGYLTRVQVEEGVETVVRCDAAFGRCRQKK